MAHKPNARTFPTHSVPAATSASRDALDFDPDPELVATFASAIRRHKARCNARDLAIEEARVRRELREQGIVIGDDA